MGYYIQVPKNKDKARQICEMYPESFIIDEPKSFAEVPKDKGLICVADNGPFEAAAFCYDMREFAAFVYPDGRLKVWVLMDRKKAEELCGFEGVK